MILRRALPLLVTPALGQAPVAQRLARVVLGCSDLQAAAERFIAAAAPGPAVTILPGGTLGDLTQLQRSCASAPSTCI